MKGAASLGASPRALHVWRDLGARPPVWIYRLLRGLSRWEPHLLTRRPRDLDRVLAEFPWPRSRMTFLDEGSRRRRRITAVTRRLSWRLLRRVDTPISRQVEELIEGSEIRLIHLHHRRHWPDLRGTRLPKVVSFYGAELRRDMPKRIRRLREVLSEGTSFVAISETVRERLQALGAPQDRITVIPVGLVPSDFPPEEEVANRRRREVTGDLGIVTVCRLVEFKAPDILPRLARMLADRGVRFRWTLIGDGRLRDDVRRNIDRYRVGDRFVMAGSQPFGAVLSYLAEADLMVHNAVVAPDGSRESLGVALMEAGAIGLPVVSCRVGGIPEVVVNGETGLLREEGDLEGLVESVVRLSEDGDLRREMGLAAMRRVRRVFDSRRLASVMEDLYDSLV